MDLLPQLRAKNIAGPVLVSVGNVDKVDLFLEKNSRVPRELLLLDTGLQAYKQVGFGKIGQNPQRAAAGAKNMQMPKGFGFRRWIDYLSSVGPLSPREPQGGRFFQDGVLQLGGTIALRGADIVFSYADGVPGDYPKAAKVLESLA